MAVIRARAVRAVPRVREIVKNALREEKNELYRISPAPVLFGSFAAARSRRRALNIVSVFRFAETIPSPRCDIAERMIILIVFIARYNSGKGSAVIKLE